MKYVKENLTLVIVGSVVLLILLFVFVPGVPGMLPALNDGVIADMHTRYTVIDSLEQSGHEALTLPGLPPATGVPSEAWVNAREKMIKSINDQKDEVAKRAEVLNAQGRVSGDLPVMPDPLGNGTRMAGFLPKLKEGEASPLNFKEQYRAQFKYWTWLLATDPKSVSLKDFDVSDALPPAQDVIKAEWDKQEQIRQAALPTGTTPGGMGGMGGMSVTAESQKAYNEFAKGRIMRRASGDANLGIPGIRMYIEPTALQRRSWLDSNESPDDQKVFEAFVDSWLQADLVRAIYQTNADAFRPGPGEAPIKQDVSRSAIKRLTRVVIGNNATARYLNTGTPGTGAMGATPAAVDPGMLFFTSTSVVGGASMAPRMGASVDMSNQGIAAGTQPTGLYLPLAENATNFALGMTGRSAGHTYDVVYMSVVMDIDPAHLFKFQDKFYRQNMGYTIVNTQARAVDPLDRASNGYLYGEGQVWEVEMLVECVLFRKWTGPLMPDAEKALLGGTSTPPQ